MSVRVRAGVHTLTELLGFRRAHEDGRVPPRARTRMRRANLIEIEEAAPEVTGAAGQPFLARRDGPSYRRPFPGSSRPRSYAGCLRRQLSASAYAGSGHTRYLVNAGRATLLVSQSRGRLAASRMDESHVWPARRTRENEETES